MKVKVLEKADIDRAVADEFVALIKRKPTAVLGLATGKSPLGVYKLLADAYKKKEVSFKKVTTFNLGEYVGLDEEDSHSYRHYMNENLFDKIDIDKANTFVPCGKDNDCHSAQEYDMKIARHGGIDILILGLGTDCTIASNEPGTDFESMTHEVVKDESRKALTMGLNSIMNAKKIILIATGKDKAQAVKDMVTASKDPAHPATVLRSHINCVAYVDKDAASLLESEVNITIIAD